MTSTGWKGFWPAPDRIEPRLRDAGIPEPQAEAIAEAIKDASDEADTATKGDISDIRRDIAETKVDLLKWMFGALAAQTAFLSAIKFFGH